MFGLWGLASSLITAFNPDWYGWVTKVGEALVDTQDVSTKKAAAVQADFDRRITKQQSSIEHLEAKVARLEAEATVVYRGKSQPLREVTEDFSLRMAARLRALAVANVGSMAGEAIPYVGVGVVIAATAYEMTETCGLMTDLREYGDALSLSAELDDTLVCGFEPPTTDELIGRVQTAPGDILVALQDTLPTWDFEAGWEDLVQKFRGMWE